MNIRETNKGNVKMVMTQEEFKALWGLVNFPRVEDWEGIAKECNAPEGTISNVWDEIRSLWAYL